MSIINPEWTVKFIVIEAIKLATDSVHISCYDAPTATYAINLYRKLKETHDKDAEKYSTTVAYEFRNIVLYPNIQEVSTYTTNLEELEEHAKTETAKEETK